MDLLLLTDGANTQASEATEQTNTSDAKALILDQLFQPAGLLMLIAQQCIPLSEAAKLSGYHEDYLGQRARLGELKAVKIGRNWITHPACLDEFCKTHPELMYIGLKDLSGVKDQKIELKKLSK